MSRPALTRARSALRRVLGVEAAPEPEGDPFPITVSERDRAIVERCNPHTMTSTERVVALIDAVRYCEARGVPGAFVECGVWRGGSVLAMLLTLQDLGVEDRDVWLYDTFEGMTPPTDLDTSPFEVSAGETFAAAEEAGHKPWPWLFDESFHEQQVRDLLRSTGYPQERLHFVRGPVEETLPGRRPDGIALLRLDTDWYESTRAEMEHLYPRLASGGVLIVDDYGHWEGARRAVDEALAEGPPLLLTRIDYTARIAVKD